MRIAIDARCLEWQRGGVARFLMNMLKYWPDMAAEHRFVLYFQNRIPEDDVLRHPHFEARVIRGPKWLKGHRILAEQILLPREIRRDNPDRLLATWYTAPLLNSCIKTVVAAWDISYSTHPAHYTLAERISLGFFSRRACRQAAGVLTCSPFDGRQIEQYYGIPRDRICVLQLAAEEQYRPPDDPGRIEALRRKYNLPARYILSLGVIYNRRNVDVIIEGFKSVYRDFPDVGLFIVGRNMTVPRADIEGAMADLTAQGRGLYLPWIAEDEIVDLYGGAWYYICTSTVDGESIMLKEAMRCGTPVITSPMLEESVAGLAVIVEDPTDRAQMAEVLRKALSSPDVRHDLAGRGLTWVQQWHWKRVAEDTLRFLENR
jgi:glycosyltransferase involved in cell wall biosynthesis